MSTYTIKSRYQIEVNTDPQRRCYNGVHFSSEMRWTEWDVICSGVSPESVEAKLKWWRELNDYAVSQRGESARKEFCAVPEGEPL